MKQCNLNNHNFKWISANSTIGGLLENNNIFYEKNFRCGTLKDPHCLQAMSAEYR